MQQGQEREAACGPGGVSRWSRRLGTALAGILLALSPIALPRLVPAAEGSNIVMLEAGLGARAEGRRQRSRDGASVTVAPKAGTVVQLRPDGALEGGSGRRPRRGRGLREALSPDPQASADGGTQADAATQPVMPVLPRNNGRGYDPNGALTVNNPDRLQLKPEVRRAIHAFIARNLLGPGGRVLDTSNGVAVIASITARPEQLLPLPSGNRQDLIETLSRRGHDVLDLTGNVFLIGPVEYPFAPEIFIDPAAESDPLLSRARELVLRTDFGVDARDAFAAADSGVVEGALDQPVESALDGLEGAPPGDEIPVLGGPGAEAGAGADPVAGADPAALAADPADPLTAAQIGDAGALAAEGGQDVRVLVVHRTDPDGPLLPRLNAPIPEVDDALRQRPTLEEPELDRMVGYLFAQVALMEKAQREGRFTYLPLLQAYAAELLAWNEALEPVVEDLMAPLTWRPAAAREPWQVAHALSAEMADPYEVTAGGTAWLAVTFANAQAPGIANDALVDRLNTLALLAAAPEAAPAADGGSDGLFGFGARAPIPAAPAPRLGRVGIAAGDDSNGKAWLGAGAHLVGNPAFGTWRQVEPPLEALGSQEEKELRTFLTVLNQPSAAVTPLTSLADTQTLVDLGQGDASIYGELAQDGAEVEDPTRYQYFVWQWRAPYSDYPELFRPGIDFVHWYFDRPWSFHTDYGRYLYGRSNEQALSDAMVILTEHRLRRYAAATQRRLDGAVVKRAAATHTLSAQTAEAMALRDPLLQGLTRLLQARAEQVARERALRAPTLPQDGALPEVDVIISPDAERLTDGTGADATVPQAERPGAVILPSTGADGSGQPDQPAVSAGMPSAFTPISAPGR